ncbi:MAG: PQQ-binding-like beta-propeller repeat protein [Fervidobacterium sp.]
MHTKGWKCFFTIAFYIGLFLSSSLFSGAIIVTSNSIVDEAGNIIKSGSFSDVLYDGVQYYYIATDGIYTLDGKTKIDIKNAQRVGINYVISSNKVYKISNGKAVTIGTVPSTLQSVVVKDDYIIGIDGNQIVCYDGSSIVWSMVVSAKTLKLSGDYLASLGTQSQLFNISNPKYIRLERSYPSYKDYAYFSGYHAFSDGTKIYIYKGSARLSSTFSYKGQLLSDGENLYSGNIMITGDLVQKDQKFTAKSLAPVILSQQETTTTAEVSDEGEESQAQAQQQTEQGSTQQEISVVKPSEKEPTIKEPKLYELIWKVVMNDEIFGKPAIKGTTAYIPTLKGSLLSVADGKIQWTFKTTFVVVAHVTVGNNIYVVSWDDTVYAVNEKGQLSWKLKLDGDISQGPAWDGYYLYVVTDNGTVYVIKDLGKSGSITTSYRTASYPVVPPSISLSGKIFVIDGVGNLWREKETSTFVGKVKNLPIVSENPYISQQLGFTLIDETGLSYEFVPMQKETQILRGKNVFLTISGQVIDAVIGKKNIYVLTDSGKFYVVDKESKKTLFTDTVQNGRYISLSSGYLFVFGNEIRCYYVNDNPSGFWNSLYGNPLNWNSAIK